MMHFGVQWDCLTAKAEGNEGEVDLLSMLNNYIKPNPENGYSKQKDYH